MTPQEVLPAITGQKDGSLTTLARKRFRPTLSDYREEVEFSAFLARCVIYCAIGFTLMGAGFSFIIETYYK